MCSRSRSRGPHAESAIDMYPSSSRVSAFANLEDGVEGAGVHIARLHTYDSALVDGWKCIEAHSPLRIDRHAHNSVSPETYQRESLLHARVHLVTGHDRERGRAK